MDNQILLERIRRIGRIRHFSNCYNRKAIMNAGRIWESDESFMFSYEDHGVQRIAFFVTDYDALDRLLDGLPDGDYYLEMMTKNPDEYSPQCMDSVARMMRMSNPDCRAAVANSLLQEFTDESIVDVASSEDVIEINRLLWSVFRPEVSHLLSDEELLEIVQKHQVFIHRGERIDAVLQAEIMPKKFYINQIINKSDKSVIHSILCRALKPYVESGGRYVYAWVEESNIASVRFHKKYGMKHDGMWSVVYRKT